MRHLQFRGARLDSACTLIKTDRFGRRREHTDGGAYEQQLITLTDLRLSRHLIQTVAFY